VCPNPNQSFDSPRRGQPGVVASTSATVGSSSLKRRKENGGLALGGGLGVGGTFYTSSTDIDRSGGRASESATCTRSRGPSYENLHFSTFLNEVEDPYPNCSINANLLSSNPAHSHHGHYSMKRFYASSQSDRGDVGGGSVEVLTSATSCNTPSRRENQQQQHRKEQHHISSLQRRAARNEHAMPIDMSEGVTNEVNFSPQSRRTLEMGTTFVGIEPSCSYLEDHSSQSHHRQHQLHHQPNSVRREQDDLEDNSSMDDGQH
jgi:hypothetical protein